MKMPKFILQVAGQYFVVPHNRGVAAIIALLGDAVPVRPNLHASPPEIELAYDGDDEDDAHLLRFVTEVRLTKIPRGVIWKRRAKSGEVEIIRPVPKPSKSLMATARVALRLEAKARAKRLDNGATQLSLGWGESK